MSRILVVEDESAIAELISINLRHAGFEVTLAGNATQAQYEVDRVLPDLVVLDWMLPGQSGVALARQWRGAVRTKELPIIMLTARAEEGDKIAGLDAGADDYVTKPFSMPELAARIAAILRRTGGAKSLYRFGTVEVDLDNYVIRHPDLEERLSNREQELLRYLIEHRGKVLPREELLTSIWKYSPNVTTRTVDTHILNVRKKLRDDAGNPRFIETMHGVGYRFVANEG